MRLDETLSRSGLAAGLVLSVLLHALVLALLPERAVFHSKVSEGMPAPTLQARLRPGERQEPSTDSGQIDATRAAKSRASRKAARKPAAKAGGPASAPPATDDAAAPAQARAGSSDKDSGRPLVDLEAARRIALEADRARERSLSELAPLDPPGSQPDTALGRDIAKAAHADCRTAHAGMGLLAIPFLIIDAITEDGCRW